MADMLTIGTLATSTFKRALDVTSHNVANVTTEGYSRQRAEIVSNTPNVVGSAFLGGGSAVSTIERINADYIQRQLYGSSAMLERYDASYSLATQVEGIVAGNDDGVKDFMQRYFDSLQTLAANPTSSVSRQLLLDEAGNLQSHVSNLSSVLNDLEVQTNNQITDLGKEINSRLESIQEINNQVSRALAVGTQPPNDLLDQRDQAILELSQYIDIKTFPQDDGSIDVHAGGGKIPLITSNTLTKLEVAASPFQDEGRVEVYAFIGGDRRVVSDKITGGQLGGVLDFRTEMLDRAQNDLGLTLNGMVASMNWQHYQGYDINGEAGGDLFAPLSVDALNNRNNTGVEDGENFVISFNPNYDGVTAGTQPPYTGTLGVDVDGQPATYGDKKALLDNAITQIGNFASREYEIRFDGTDYQFYDHKSKELLTPLEQPAGSNRFQLDGLEFDLSASLGSDVGDVFLVKPHQAILDSFEVALRDPEKLATRGQSPVETGAFTGTSGAPLTDSSPPEAAAYGDNTNMANMASLQTKEILFSDDNGVASSTLLGGYSIMASNVGLYVRGNDIQLTAQENVYQQLVDRRDSLSGVSLDEEAANLLRFQQAYEASAQIISTSQSLFQTLLSVVRG
ncbi:hypothetical protein THMIRHAS_08870 [Thiosulfatimonas sediminis]|uniref:Flagellar hook-associated protein 1 n=1 Tax=Thiosulfatimonas sediminis TaxID=2675054 RepID=A0A6F8PU21_9GAMM|nr:flagellar hook-associated protein FlgK [Thiosulfatimonas sediminis]BBP45514.1 hypothetical protein THMIRHAS_08870 [Thiosulfatimonas sediminis]